MSPSSNELLEAKVEYGDEKLDLGRKKAGVILLQQVYARQEKEPIHKKGFIGSILRTADRIINSFFHDEKALALSKEYPRLILLLDYLENIPSNGNNSDIEYATAIQFAIDECSVSLEEDKSKQLQKHVESIKENFFNSLEAYITSQQKISRLSPEHARKEATTNILEWQKSVFPDTFSTHAIQTGKKEYLEQPSLWQKFLAFFGKKDPILNYFKKIEEAGNALKEARNKPNSDIKEIANHQFSVYQAVTALVVVLPNKYESVKGRLQDELNDFSRHYNSEILAATTKNKSEHIKQKSVRDEYQALEQDHEKLTTQEKILIQKNAVLEESIKFLSAKKETIAKAMRNPEVLETLKSQIKELNDNAVVNVLKIQELKEIIARLQKTHADFIEEAEQQFKLPNALTIPENKPKSNVNLDISATEWFEEIRKIKYMPSASFDADSENNQLDATSENVKKLPTFETMQEALPNMRTHKQQLEETIRTLEKEHARLKSEELTLNDEINEFGKSSNLEATAHYHKLKELENNFSNYVSQQNLEIHIYLAQISYVENQVARQQDANILKATEDALHHNSINTHLDSTKEGAKKRADILNALYQEQKVHTTLQEMIKINLKDANFTDPQLTEVQLEQLVAIILGKKQASLLEKEKTLAKKKEELHQESLLGKIKTVLGGDKTAEQMKKQKETEYLALENSLKNEQYVFDLEKAELIKALVIEAEKIIHGSTKENVQTQIKSYENNPGLENVM